MDDDEDSEPSTDGTFRPAMSLVDPVVPDTAASAGTTSHPSSGDGESAMAMGMFGKLGVILRG